MKKLIIILPMIILFLLSCNDNTTNQTVADTSTIIPLKTGNTWIMKITKYDSAGAVTGFSGDTIIVKNDSMYNNEKFYFVYEHISENQNANRMGAINRSDGFHYLIFYEVQGNITVLDYFMYNYPAKPGDTFTANEATTTVIKTDTVINNSLGSFKCYVYKIEAMYGDNYNMNLIYLCPGKGFVYSEFYYAYQNGPKYLKAKHELVSNILY
jgi:hypothetical protein